MRKAVIYWLSGLILSKSAIAGSLIVSTPLVQSNSLFSVEWDLTSGGLKSLVLHDDPDRMNWIEGTGVWGESLGYTAKDRGRNRKFKFTGIKRMGDTTVSCYQFENRLKLEVFRRMSRDYLEETYRIKNDSRFPVYFQRGHLGILTSFNDNYTNADICERKRCHAHLWPKGECAWIHAKKMGPFGTELALIMTEGALDGYSVRRIAADYSNDRGDFVLHPEPFNLLPGESRAFSWRIVAFPAGDFSRALLRNGSAVISFKHETVFPGEEFEITVKGPDGKVERHIKKADRGTGEYPFLFDVSGKKAFARGRASLGFSEIVNRRIDFIVSKQQCLDDKSPLYGAYLIYDNEEKAQYFDEAWCDHNACRERLGMGILIACWLQKNSNGRVLNSLNLFEEFVLREFFDKRTGAVYNTIGMDPNFKRLYNAPWMITFFSEMYKLKKKSEYLDYIERIIFNYYANGGARFYPNGCTFADAIELIGSAGRDTAHIKKAVMPHINNLVSNGTLYPAHEVNFEQTIATVPVAMLSDWCTKIESSKKIGDVLKNQVGILRRFDGDQPDYRLNALPIRHWDAMWFGKRRLYGDTHHYWSVLSGNAYLAYFRFTNDGRYLKYAEKCFRNSLWSFFEDGSASCAYIHPHSVTMLDRKGEQIDCTQEGERFDVFANDQDYALYFILRSNLLSADQ